MILAKREIIELINKGNLKIEPFNEEIVRENGLDLRIGEEYATYSFQNHIIDPYSIDSSDFLFSRVLAKDGRIVIPPRNFVLLVTKEKIKMPKDVVGLCNLRSTLARYGLSVPPTVIDAGFEGNVVIEVVNNSQNYVILKPNTRFLHVILIKLTSESQYKGKYQGQTGLTLPKSLKDEK